MHKLRHFVSVLAVLLTASTVSVPGLAASGKSTYRKTCGYCHEYGVSGAPRLGNHEDWGPRVAKGKSVLYQHAIQGFKGMPARGANSKLSDSDVRNAVDYLLEHAE